MTAQLSALKDLYSHSGPFATAYLDASRDTETGAHEVDLRWRALRDRLLEAGADAATLEAMDAVVDADRSPGKHGLAVVAAEGQVLFDATTPVPPSRELAAYSPVPHLMPYFAQQAGRPDYVVVVADRTGAEIRSMTASGEQSSATVEGSAQYPLHKTGRNDWSELHFQHRVENSGETNAREVADAVQRHVAASRVTLVVVAGEEQGRTTLAAQLGKSVDGAEVVEVTAGGRAAGASEDALNEAVRDAVLAHVWRERRALLERMQQDVGRGEFAATGVSGVLEALREARVDTVVLSDDPTSTLTAWFGDDPTQLALTQDEITDLGVENPRQDRLDAVLIRTVVNTGANLVVTPGAHDYLPEGVGALLRY